MRTVTLLAALLAALICGLAIVGSQNAAAAGIPRAAGEYREDLVLNARYVWGLNAPVASFAAQIHQESHWQADAHSSVGAQGLAEFMPATARWMASIYPQLRSIPSNTPDPVASGAQVAEATAQAQGNTTKGGCNSTCARDGAPFNPVWSIRALLLYDDNLFKQVHARNACDQFALALSAYNGGLGWVYKDVALTRRMGADPLTWFGSVEKFNAGRSAAAFRENRGYPVVILRRYEPLYVKAGWGQGVCAAQGGAHAA